ncbi:hypothetical protein E8E11_002753 [Didymella keratinophila]|nr:hypothetical protein E8E11_002753 [Didymella keratinophila]
MYARTLLLLSALTITGLAAPVPYSELLQRSESIVARNDIALHAASLDIPKRGTIVEVLPVEARSTDDLATVLDAIHKRDRSQGGHSGGKREADRSQKGHSSGKREASPDRSQKGHSGGKREADRSQGGHSGGKREADRSQGGHSGGKREADRSQGGHSSGKREAERSLKGHSSG